MTNYSRSKCPKCENSRFEMVEDAPEGSNFKMMFIRCTSCKTVIGVGDYYNIGTLIHELARKLNVRLD
ncbi:hypothetical protein ATB97_19325 [Elizabethkingia bruuniana]|uniref:hypothetical protein n=1 Tax=Elizabethkingia anophelis TaxID=1117645 RepID=UPI00052D56B8|nr:MULTISPECIES: hypothetical protein [Elizabethkingia]KGO11980.1 hypothetical protein KS04_00890 [Elizabethkingia miricola]AQX86124.1 hypothetical protein AYC65_14415 [Elizabethkingia bruuniana]AQX86518.1 hypothetical protein AYC65_16580 [Elizabethkingia bruuniana]KUY27263.1 hypothetical protein ATB97_19325 [Elizabethkingia bruuniana]MCT3645734.1 hypothetical protein [Elizabethkingia anophelis]